MAMAGGISEHMFTSWSGLFRPGRLSAIFLQGSSREATFVTSRLRSTPRQVPNEKDSTLKRKCEMFSTLKSNFRVIKG